MKYLTLMIATLLTSTILLAETVSQKTARDLAAVLQTNEVVELLSEENEIGDFTGIRYLMSYKATFGPVVYELSFATQFGADTQLCNIAVEVNKLTNKVMTVGSPECVAR